MSPLPARSPPRREPAPACSSSSLCPGGPVPAAGACSWGTAWALRSLDGFGVRGGTELPFPSRLLGAAGRGAGWAACPLGLCGALSAVRRGKGTSVLVPGSSLAGFTRGTRASEPDGPCVRSGGEAVPHVGRGRRRGSAQEGAADVASSARCRSGTWCSPGFSQLAQQLCRAVALLVSISWCFLVSSGSGRRGGALLELEGRPWWPQPPFGGHAAPGPCRVSPRPFQLGTRRRLGACCPAPPLRPGSALLLKTKMLPLFRAAAQKNLFAKDTDCLSTGRQ